MAFWDDIFGRLSNDTPDGGSPSSNEYWTNLFGYYGGDQPTQGPLHLAMPTQETHTEDRGVIPTPGAAPAGPLPAIPAFETPTDTGGAPRYAMPTQEVHTPQRFLDQSVGAEPTATQDAGLAASIVGTMRQDPLALVGYGPNVIDWAHSPRANPRRTSAGTEYVAGEYIVPTQQRYDWANISDSIRFWQGSPQYPDLPSVVGHPDFTPTGRHEFRHRGTEHLQQLAQVYGIPFDPEIARLPYNESERVNVYEDRRLGDASSYPSMTFPANRPIEPGAPQINERTMVYLRSIADRILSAQTQWLYNNPGRTLADRAAMENYGSPLALR